MFSLVQFSLETRLESVLQNETQMILSYANLNSEWFTYFEHFVY